MDAPSIGFSEVKEAKASFLHAAASENQTVKAYIYGKDELKHFKLMLEEVQGYIERVKGENSTNIEQKLKIPKNQSCSL